MIKQEIGDSAIKQHLDSLETDRMEIFLLEQGTVRGAFLNGTRMINEMRANHDLGILETLILGHAYLAAALLTSMMKEGDRMVLSVECGGPVKGFSVEVNALGEVRGYLQVNPVPIDAPLESFDLSPFFGPGFLKVTRHPAGDASPYSGQVMMEYGSVAKDLAVYFLRSEQIPTLFYLSIQFDPEGKVTGAGGLFLQALPGAGEAQLGEIEESVKNFESPGLLISQGKTVRSILTSFFDNNGLHFLGTGWVQFFCRCSKERFGSFLSSFSDEEKRSILAEGPIPLETTCHNCNTTYVFTREELESLFYSGSS